MAMESESHIFEVRNEDAVEMCRALALDCRFAILQHLAGGEKNINELGTLLGVSQPTGTKQIQQLEQAGVVVSEYMPGVQGMQKRCRLRYNRLIINLAPDIVTD